MAVDIECTAEESGWRCLVVVNGPAGRTAHLVDVTQADLARLDPDAKRPDRLVRASFDFLLERESNASILREFELPEIGRYFPDFERVIGSRLQAND
jgi:hypothetical protein